MKDNATIEKVRVYPSPNPNVRLQEITYWSDGLKVKGLMAEPIKEGRYEGIVYLRGGIQHVGMVRPSRMALLASNGFVVFAPYYRGNRGGEGRDEFAGDDRLDAVNAVDILKQNPKVRRNRIHLFAFSRGGIMALWTAVLRDDITSVVTWAGVSDIVFTYKERKDMRRMMKRVIGGTPNNQADAYRERNVLDRLNELEAPVLIIHGMLDAHVSIEQAKILENALHENNKQYETWYFPEFTHHIPPVQNTKIVKDLCDWMRRQDYSEEV
ncbi:S9 family peptidase [Sporosarcina pasteurii]|uniref:Prolyl tripeptidyl peptidase n=1 Tax=Sporosarcina pasteurii TaxID=1474 RepID=A0A380C7D7_SPOPA|nr:prolyl oligopeptidase family serine peptidase [Sporosarcina pasteurii]MDS9472961.1 prolyl oligopeptidase family serine peptidase [Sporosarcina pasteurii]QBQ04477.1 S9 family peptidase [Sporosarcina pasteurii]SUJ14582.1 Prolyl tripeptidyl peptidase precursor [Sporosarcina pasteurii]